MSSTSLTLIDHDIPAYVPAAGNSAAPLVVVVHEIYGLNAEVRRVADELAAQGFEAVAPDLLWRIAPGTVFGYDERDAAIAQVRALDEAQLEADLARVLGWLKQQQAVPRRIGLLSLGWGGKFAFAAALAEPVDALVAYYPGNIGRVPEPAAVRAPVLIHFGAHDPTTPPELIDRLRAAFEGRAEVVLAVHAEAAHGFANRDRVEFHPASAEAADADTASFLQRALSPSI